MIIIVILVILVLSDTLKKMINKCANNIGLLFSKAISSTI